ncbi:organic cation transporter protein-like isoform X3 [Crassostrea virginica]|nr:organic cation transporter protein-like isoform X3 [Crassostrea virginica]XP_022287713.1 organic cation transporter protein-like isoform X3 [Crassostrea virginica]XP_022287714.1 organic cation transporter protein-like isoform X3 [Crassostrea virginica]
MKFDDIFKEIGEFGPYQRRNYVVLMFGWMITGPIMVLSVFVMGNPGHRCQIPGLGNDTYAIQGPNHNSLVHKYIPLDVDGLYDKCHLFNIDQSAASFDNDSRPINASKTKCSAWVYDKTLFYETFVMKENLVCDNKYKISLSKTIFFAGVFSGSFCFGMISDLIGRKKTLLIGVLFQLASTLALAWSQNYLMYVLLRFCTGAAVAGVFMTTYVLAMEWVGPSRRTYAGIIMTFFGPVGDLYALLISYFARDWFWILLGVSLPFAILFLLYCFLPESPRWLYGTGRKKEAGLLLEKAAKYNGKEASSKLLDNVVLEKKEAGKIWLLFSDRRLGVRTVIIYFNWLVTSMVFYGLSLNTGILYGDYYINFLIVVLVEFPGHALPLVMIDRLGRKRSYFIYMGVGGLACLSTIFTVNYGGQDLQYLTTALAMLGKLFAAAGSVTIYVLSAELFPTAIRNVGMGSSSSWGRVGGMIFPFIADTADLVGGRSGTALPLSIFGGACLLAALLTLILPETLHQMLPETIEDGKNFATGQTNWIIMSQELDDPKVCNLEKWRGMLIGRESSGIP